LVIEIDGGVHEDPDAIAYDRERTLVLGWRGLKVIRLKNEAVTLENLLAAIQRVGAGPPPLPKGEGAGGEV
jgi:very-short-patch-repair endonuclease